MFYQHACIKHSNSDNAAQNLNHVTDKYLSWPMCIRI